MTGVLHELLYMAPICLAVTIVCEPYVDGPENRAIICLFACAVLGLCMVIRHVKNKIKYLFPGVAVCFAAGILLIHPVEEWGDLLWDGRWVFLVAMEAVISFFAGWLIVMNRMIARIFAVSLFGALVLGMIFFRTPEKAVIDLALFLLILFAADEIQFYWKKSGKPDIRGHMVSIAPFLLVLGLLVYLVPAPEEPYDWNFAVQAWEKVTDAVRWVGRWFGSDEDYDAVIGFSDSGSFYGNLADSDEIVMRLSGNQNQGSVVYLRGKVMDSFDGRSWTDTYSDENRDDMLDVLETLCAVHRFDPEYLGNYLRKTELKLKYEDFNTRYLFAPLKALPRWNHIDQKTYTERGGNLIAGEQLGYGTEYAVSYYRMNRDHAEFERLLETAKRPDEALWNDIRAKYESRDTGGVRTEERDNGISGISYPAYLSYRDRIRAYYLPETKLSEGVAAYVTGITEGAETDYEKLKRIEQALGGFRYSVNPGVLAEEVVSPETFLDDFILKKQEGYCSYFATAFVLLARSQGIPARYVQGFRVPTKGKNSVEVRSGMSHAWPEAYLDGVGWIAFEPTPGKKSPVSWSVLKKQERVTDAGEGIEEHEELTRPEQTVPDPDSATGGEDSPFSIRLILIPVGLIAAFLLVFLLAGRLAAVARYRRLDEKGRFRVICNRNFRILDYLGYSIRQGETLEELYERANENMKSDALAFLKECELVAYAGKPVDRESLSGAEKSRNALLEHLKEKKGKWFFLYRFRLSRES